MNLLPLFEKARDVVLAQEIPKKIAALKTSFPTSQKTKYIVGIILDVFIIFAVLFQGAHANPQSLISPLGTNQFVSLLFAQSASNQTMSITLRNGETIPIPNLEGLFTNDMKYRDTIIARANDFMSLPPDSDRRAQKELRLFEFLTKNNASASDVLLALQACATTSARAWGMEELWQLRQSGKLSEYNIFPLSQVNIQWAKDHNVDPRILGIAIDTYGVTVKLVQSEPRLFFEAAKNKANDSEVTKYVPSPAVIARLQMSETGWPFQNVLSDISQYGATWQFPKTFSTDIAFVNIGNVDAWDAINLDSDWFPSGHDDLSWIAQQLQNTSGLPYRAHIENIPGSARGYGDGSGGAIGPQLMPINARLFMNWYSTANEKIGNVFPNPNPFNPYTGMILTSLYVTSEFYHRQESINNITSVVRPGYSIIQSPNEMDRQDPRLKALMKWNPLLWEARAAVQAGEDYNSIWRSENLHTMIQSSQTFD